MLPFVTHVTASCSSPAYTEGMTEKQFRERARSELRQIGDQLKGLATDRDIYWKFEREIVATNPQLHDGRSGFLDMTRGCYAEAMTARLLRLLEPQDGSASLHRILVQLPDHPELLNDKITERELVNDCRTLKGAAADLRNVTMPRAAHYERTLSALASTHRELNSVLDMLIATVKTYYWIVNDGYIDLDVRHAEDPMAIFQSAWAVPVLAK